MGKVLAHSFRCDQIPDLLQSESIVEVFLCVIFVKESFIIIVFVNSKTRFDSQTVCDLRKILTYVGK